MIHQMPEMPLCPLPGFRNEPQRSVDGRGEGCQVQEDNHEKVEKQRGLNE